MQIFKQCFHPLWQIMILCTSLRIPKWIKIIAEKIDLIASPVVIFKVFEPFEPHAEGMICKQVENYGRQG